MILDINPLARISTLRVKRISTFLTAVLASTIVAPLVGCGGKNEPIKAPRAVMTAELVSPSRQAWPDTLSASGEVVPWQEAIVGAEVAGVRLEKVQVNVGDKVRKGQLLAQYDESTLRADLAALDASVAEAAAHLATARADAERADKLEHTASLSQQAIQIYRAQAKAAQARLDAVRAQRDAQALRVGYARVVAPDDGVISSRSAAVGEVDVTGTELFRLVRRNRLEWRAEVAAEALARLRPGSSVIVNTADGKSINASLRQLAPTVNSGTRNGIAYVDLPVDCGLAAGMYVSGRFMLAARDALVIPESALVLRDGNKYLMQVDAGRHAWEIKVETGRRGDDLIEILGAIDPAARFVKAGGAFVSNGDLVQIADARSSQ